jgi:hypothetical protein
MEQSNLIDPAGISNENDEWYTPSWVFEALDMHFDLDPCSPGVPPSNVPADRHITKEENGLAAEWDGCVWLNPPFSSKYEWYDRMFNHNNGIALVPAKTEVAGIQQVLARCYGFLLLSGRVYFERGCRPGGNGRGRTTCPPFGIALCAFGLPAYNHLYNSNLMGLRCEVMKP